MKRTPFGILALLLALTLLAGCSSNTSKSLAEDAWETPAFAQEAVGDLALPGTGVTIPAAQPYEQFPQPGAGAAP